VFISGFGDGIDNSRQVAAVLARHSTVLIFDRAGYGDSDSSNSPPDGDQISSELDGVIQASGLTPPVIIVGHSAGGEYGEYYAQRHSDKVAGLVLDDARPIDFTRRCLANVPRKTCVVSPRLIRLLPRALRLEYGSLEKVAADIGAHPNYSGPVMIMARGGPSGDGWKFDEQWTKAQAATAARYRTVVLTSPMGGHYIHRDAPAWFEQNIASFLERVRASASPASKSAFDRP
jgi:pimeloyl-ACP methyl ester carboxylesterase